MKHNTISTYLKINVVVLILSMLTSCSTNSESTTEEAKLTPPPKPQPSQVEKHVKPSIKQFHISTLDHQELAYLSIDKAFTFVSIGSEQLNGELKGDKRKYINASGRITYIAKISDDGFKLRDSLDVLLWKVKTYPDKIKIANNEEMSNPIEIKRTDNSKIKIEKDGTELLKWKVANANESGKTNLLDKFLISGFEQSLSSGVLLLEAIPTDQQYVLTLELLDQNK